MKNRHPDPVFWLCLVSGCMVSVFILFPLGQMIFEPSMEGLFAAAGDKTVQKALWLSVSASLAASGIAFFLGTPFAYLLARKTFPGKRLVESIVDLPIMIPHPIIGIAILGLVGRNHFIGKTLQELGIRVMGSTTGIVVVMAFVGLPFYLNTVKAGFEAVPPRLEKVSRSLGASPFQCFFRVTFPMAWRSMLVGVIMCSARAISEFGAIIIVSYHPMVAPVLIYERFTAYGLKYAIPVAVLLIGICLVLFIVLRLLSAANPQKWES